MGPVSFSLWVRRTCLYRGRMFMQGFSQLTAMLWISRRTKFTCVLFPFRNNSSPCSQLTFDITHDRLSRCWRQERNGVSSLVLKSCVQENGDKWWFGFTLLMSTTLKLWRPICRSMSSILAWFRSQSKRSTLQWLCWFWHGYVLLLLCFATFLCSILERAAMRRPHSHRHQPQPQICHWGGFLLGAEDCHWSQAAIPSPALHERCRLEWLLVALTDMLGIKVSVNEDTEMKEKYPTLPWFFSHC